MIANATAAFSRRYRAPPPARRYKAPPPARRRPPPPARAPPPSSGTRCDQIDAVLCKRALTQKLQLEALASELEFCKWRNSYTSYILGARAAFCTKRPPSVPNALQRTPILEPFDIKRKKPRQHFRGRGFGGFLFGVRPSQVLLSSALLRFYSAAPFASAAVFSPQMRPSTE